MIDKSSRALRERDASLAYQVVESDTEVDRLEVQLEEELLKILALHQPVAADLRRIVTLLKINNDLERMADLAVNIAERAQRLVRHPEFPIPKTLDMMVEKTCGMVHKALDAFVQVDAATARDVWHEDDTVDQYNRDVITQLKAAMQKDSETVGPALHCFSAARHLERIADHATNIAEDVIYLIEGEIARHHPDILQTPNG